MVTALDREDEWRLDTREQVVAVLKASVSECMLCVCTPVQQQAPQVGWLVQQSATQAGEVVPAQAASHTCRKSQAA